MPPFPFVVTIPGVGQAFFTEVSGLEASSPVTPDSTALARKIPGLRKTGNITLKRGIVTARKGFSDWHDQTQTNPQARLPVTLSLLDERGKPAKTWTLHNAWPTKLTAPNLKADGNEVAIETLSLSHEGLSTNI